MGVRQGLVAMRLEGLGRADRETPESAPLLGAMGKCLSKQRRDMVRFVGGKSRGEGTG